MRISIKRLLLTLAVAMITTFAFGQGATTSAFNGKVYDAKGVSLPGATVQFTHLPTGTKYGTVTNANGFFLVPNVKPGGPYSMVVTFVGFSEFKKDDINVGLGDNLQSDANLVDQNVKIEEVVVSGSKVFNSKRTGVATNVTSKDIATMPTISRSVSDFARLSPLVSITSSGGISIAGSNNKFNNFQIDGTVNNDVFGLSSAGTNGGQAGTTPISIDVIEEFRVVAAPYDVRQGGFTGGGINAITKSGTNTFHGTVYGYGNNQDLVGRYSWAQEKKSVADKYKEGLFGVSLGGPIIKNKLFFFVNGEFAKKTQPSSYNIGEGSNITLEQATQFANKLKELMPNYDNGGFNKYTNARASNKLFARIDYNINNKHKLTFRYNYVDASDDNISRSKTVLNFNNSGYIFNNKTHGFVTELNSVFNSVFSNELRIGYNRIRDARELMGGQRAPYIIIRNVLPADKNGINAGAERYSNVNYLNQDIFTFSDNFSAFLGQHTITVGTQNELYKIENAFIRDNSGVYTYTTLNDFLTNPNTPTGGYSYSTADPLTTNGNKQWAPSFKAMQLGFYAQDEYRPLDNLKLTLGVRADIPIFLSDPSYNKVFNDSLKLSSEMGVATNKLPNARVLWSPRFGFNWDVFKDKKTQVRGGAGIFTGKIPFVWISNQFSNTGVEYARINITNAGGLPAGFVFQGDPDKQWPYPLVAKDKKSEIDVTSKNFKYPRVFRANLGVDQVLPEDFVLTLDALYTKNISTITYKNIKYVDSNTKIKEGTQSERTLLSVYNDPYIGRFNDIILLDNTSKGYSYTLTAQLTKKFRFGLSTMAAYTYGHSKSVNDGTSSQALSGWQYNLVNSNSNNPELATSSYDVGNKIIASVNYSKSWGKWGKTTVGLFYTGYTGVPYSYTYSGNSYVDSKGKTGVYSPGGSASINGDGYRTNDLIYIPTADEIKNYFFMPIYSTEKDASGNAKVLVDEETQRKSLADFLSSDSYTKSRRGTYAERNGIRLPWENHIDLHVAHDFIFKAAGRNQTIQISFDVLNFGNMLNKDWGKSYFVSNGVYELINFVGYKGTTAAPDYNSPIFQFVKPTNKIEQISDFASRWRGQIGIRYIF